MNNPSYIKDAKFIDSTSDVDEGVWPKNVRYYKRTNNWNNRIRRIKGVIEYDEIVETVRNGNLYDSLSNSVTFVRDVSGVAIYVIVSAELIDVNGNYPTNPSYHDYKYKAVTLWLYVHDELEAKESGVWSSDDIESIRQLCESESGQSELSKHTP